MQQFRLTVLFPAVTFALVGAFLSIILLVQHGRAERGECGAGCADVLSSRWAYFPPSDPVHGETPGVPLALLGVVYFAGLALWLMVVGKVSGRQRLWHSLPMAMALLGALVSIVLISGMAFMETWCPLCLAVHVVNLALVPYIYFCRPEEDAEETEIVSRELRPVLTGAALVISAGAASWFGYDSFRYRERHQALAVALARARVEASRTEEGNGPHMASLRGGSAAVSSDSEWVVNSTSPDPDTVVVYTDLMCSHCRAFEERLFQVWGPKFHDHLRVAIKHFPLCAQCNHGSADVHPWACEAAYLAEAGRVVGGAEGFLRVLRAISPRRTQPWTEEDAIALAVEAGLTPQKFLEAWQSEAVRDRVARDIAEARQLGVQETPSVFVNGRRLDRQTRDLPEYWEQLAARPRRMDRQVASPAEDSLASTRSLPVNSSLSSGDSVTHSVAKPVVKTQEPLTNQSASLEKPAVTSTSTSKNSASKNSEATVTLKAAEAKDQNPDQERRLRIARTMLSLHDSNKDGALQPDEWGKLYGDGSKIDTNHDQRISLEEIAAGIVEIHGEEDQPAPSGGAAAPAKPAPETPRISTIYAGDQLEITGPTLDGQTFDLSRHRGKPVLVAFWACWCPHCLDETPELMRLYRKYHPSGLEIVGVNADIATEVAREFVEKNQIPWPQIHFTTEGERGRANPLARRYNVRGYPALFLVDGEGRVVGVHLRGRDLELAIARAIGVPPTPEDQARQERTELAASLFRPSHVPQEKNMTVEVGDRLHLAGPTLDGGHFDLSQQLGKPVLVAFWASWCPHCKRELPVIKAVYERYRDQGLVVVGVSTDRKKAELEAYLAEHPVPWPNIFYDDDGLRGFHNPLVYWHGVRGVPAVFLVDREGKVAGVKLRGDSIEREVARVLGGEPSVAAQRSSVEALGQPIGGVKNPQETTQRNGSAELEPQNKHSAAAPTQPSTVSTPTATGEPNSSKKSSFDTTPAPVLAHGVVKRYDTNGDGQLQKDEFAKMPGDFAKYDSNQDGVLTVEELTIAIGVAQRLKQMLPSQFPTPVTRPPASDNKTASPR